INEFLKKNIKTDFMVSIDPGDPAFELIKKSVDIYKMPPLFTYIEGNYKVVENHNNIKVLMNSLYVPLQDFGNSVDAIPSGPSVANVAVAIADYLGCNPIVLVGQDLAYTNGKHHSNVAISDFDKNSPEKVATIQVDGFFGDSVKTTAQFYSMLSWFENWISESNKNFFNCTEGGVWIHGCEHMKLSEYIKEFNNTTTTISYPKLKDFIPDKQKFKPQKPVGEYVEKLMTLTQKMNRAVYHSNKILSSIKINNENSLQSHLLKLEKIDTFVMSEMKNDTMLNYLFASAKVDFENEKRKFSKNDKLSIAKSNLKFYESLFKNFEYLLTWFEEMKNETVN
ncbi:MAG: 6-hydroxymethylpterin diphosphokinase MptE-like protein, partial [Bacillota bacterium]|nr:6-hydroxymethylpterin diphosphokinase MptE-like protein [Bacillota bacterium]